MKLVGEYEMTDNGVVIEGKVNDSKIHDVRSLLKPFKEINMYHGEKPSGHLQGTQRLSYTVPHPVYRACIMRQLPGLITPDVERKYMNIKKDFHFEGRETSYCDARTFHNNLGIIYGDGDGSVIIDKRDLYSFYSMRSDRTRFLTNSAWIWNVAKDGSFRVELSGLVNRHMVTLVLGNATRLAKYIDEVLVKMLDHSDKIKVSPEGDW